VSFAKVRLAYSRHWTRLSISRLGGTSLAAAVSFAKVRLALSRRRTWVTILNLGGTSLAATVGYAEIGLALSKLCLVAFCCTIRMLAFLFYALPLDAHRRGANRQRPRDGCTHTQTVSPINGHHKGNAIEKNACKQQGAQVRHGSTVRTDKGLSMGLAAVSGVSKLHLSFLGCDLQKSQRKLVGDHKHKRKEHGNHIQLRGACSVYGHSHGGAVEAIS